MFDPFNDFGQSGYLRNLYGEKDPEIVRELEHTMFRAGLDDALAYLEKRKSLCYEDFWQYIRFYFKSFIHGLVRIVKKQPPIALCQKLARFSVIPWTLAGLLMKGYA